MTSDPAPATSVGHTSLAGTVNPATPSQPASHRWPDQIKQWTTGDELATLQALVGQTKRRRRWVLSSFGLVGIALIVATVWMWISGGELSQNEGAFATACVAMVLTMWAWIGRNLPTVSADQISGILGKPLASHYVRLIQDDADVTVEPLVLLFYGVVAFVIASLSFFS